MQVHWSTVNLGFNQCIILMFLRMLNRGLRRLIEMVGSCLLIFLVAGFMRILVLSGHFPKLDYDLLTLPESLMYIPINIFI